VAYDVGNWVRFTRSVDGAAEGQKGKVTSTGWTGDLDITLENGSVVKGVDSGAVQHSSPGSSNSPCLVVALALIGGLAGLGWAAVELGRWVW
jgi:hypothetical protein